MAVTSRRARIGQALYAALFLVVLPVTLIAWARALNAVVVLPAVHAPWTGSVITAIGVLVWLAGVMEIVRRGRGLPMNAFPPPQYVSSGIYRLVSHPIYVGWAMAAAGVSLISGSAAGLWIVTPCIALGSTALVLGYERHDLRRRFGSAAIYRPLFSLPPEDDRQPGAHERLALWIVVALPWLAAYVAVKTLGVPPDAFDVRFEAEKIWPVWIWTVPIYTSAYVVVPLTVFAVGTRSHLRRLAVQGLVATGVITLIYLVVPAVAPFREAAGTSVLGRLLAIDQEWASPPVAALPAFHAVWAFFAAEALASRSRAWAVTGWVWGAAVAVSCITTGMHAVVDVVAAVIVWVPLRRPDAVWHNVLGATERLANSWRATRWGPMRVMRHGVYAGVAAGVGVIVIAALAGPDALTAVLVIALSTLVGAGLWAQLVEGSPALLRPFGYYGAIAGGMAGAGVIAVAGGPAALVLGATAVAAPLVQAVGRLRCIAQGCCHGGETDPRYGIRVSNPHSRVVALAGLADRPLHPTQLYSIVGNLIIGVLLFRGWTLGLPIWFLTGSYLVLAGIARFMEEGFRAEPQTITWRGLPIYQYLSVASVGLGMWLMTWPGAAAPPVVWPDPPVVVAATITGLLYWFAMGVDFPESSRRFARLSG